MNTLDSTLSFHQTALRLRSQRQELLAANIANADTPNFKARDIDFNTSMRAALSGMAGSAAEIGGAAAVVQIKTNAAHFSGNGNNMFGGLGDAKYRIAAQDSADGNTVDMDVERNQFADNAIRYEASLVMLNSELKRVLSAIQGQ